ncbi:MAG: response regulator [Anaerolineae bacterium]
MAKILVIDDSDLARKLVRQILEPDGHQILEATNGLAALESYSLEQPDLVMLDLTMEGMHGLEVLSQLRALDPRARIVVATADIQDATRRLVGELGAVGFVTKPFRADAVRETVMAALKGGTEHAAQP